jgi:hypothetical protein
MNPDPETKSRADGSVRRISIEPAMMERSVPLKMFRITRILVVALLSIAGMSILLTYGPLRAQTSRAQKSNFDMAQFTADARTLVGMIAYLLEPEPADLVVDSIYEQQRKSTLLGQNFENSADKSVRSTFSATNGPSSG